MAARRTAADGERGRQRSFLNTPERFERERTVPDHPQTKKKEATAFQCGRGGIYRMTNLANALNQAMQKLR